jgi:hypothetical protein
MDARRYVSLSTPLQTHHVIDTQLVLDQYQYSIINYIQTTLRNLNCAKDDLCQRHSCKAEMKCAQEVKVSLLYQEK